jgi:hypothetical protein
VAVAASGTIIAKLGKPETAQLVSETQVPQIHLIAVVDVHETAALRTQAIPGTGLEFSMQQVHLSV